MNLSLIQSLNRYSCTNILLKKSLKINIEKNEELKKENKRQSKLIDELLNENKAYKRAVADWRLKDAN